MTTTIIMSLQDSTTTATMSKFYLHVAFPQRLKVDDQLFNLLCAVLLIAVCTLLDDRMT